MMRTLFSFFLLLAACNGADEPVETASTSCLDLWVDGITEPDASGPDTQFHGTSVFDGDNIWVAWNRRDSGTLFDVWMARYTCDGEVDRVPFEVTSSGSSELDPVLAVSGDRVMVAWSADSGGQFNLDIRYRLYDLDGSAVTDVIELAANRGGVPVTGNATQPAVAATADGFTLAGSWGHADATGFQVFAVSIGPDGQVIGDAQDAELDTAFGQTAVDVAEDAGTHLIWQEDSTTSTAPALSGGVVGQGSAQIADPGARPSIAAHGGLIWRAWDTDAGAIVVQTPSGAEVTLVGGSFTHSPSIAASDTGAVVVGMQSVQTVYNSLTLWQLDAQGGVIAERLLDTTGAPSPYPVDVTLIDADHALVVYQDGPNPDFRLRAAWISL